MKKSAMFRFLVTYLCVLLPIMLVTVLVTQDMLNSIEAERKESLTEQLTDSANTVSEYYSYIPSKGASLFDSSVLAEYNVFRDPVICREAISLLSNIQNFNGHQESVAVYYGGSLMITSSGTCSPRIYFSSDVGAQTAAVNQAIDIVKSTESQILYLPQRGTGGSILYHLAVGMDGYGRQRSVEVVTDVAQIAHMLRSTLRNDHVLLQIRLGEDTLYFYNTDKSCTFVSQDLAKDLMDGFQNIHWTQELDAGEMRFAIVCDFDDQLSEFYHLRNISIGLLCGGLLISFVLSVALSYIRFARLEKLIHNIRHRQPGTARKKHWVGAEMDYIQTLFDGYISENKTGRQKLFEYQHLLLRQVSMLMFYGSLRNADEINAVLSACGRELNEEYFFVLAIKVENPRQMENLDQLLQGDIHCTANNDENVMFVLCEISHTDEDRSERLATMNRLHSTLESVHIDCAQMAISQVYDEIDKVNFAFLESYNIIENYSEALPKIVAWEDYILREENEKAKFEIEYINEFRYAINSEDAQAAVDIMSRAMEQMDVQGDPAQSEKLRYTFEQLLIVELTNQDEGQDETLIARQVAQLKGKSWNEYRSGLLEILRKAFEAQDSGVPFDRVLEFVEKNFNQSNFSLEMVADYVGCSKSKMSKLFRNQMGISYLEYVTNLRMNMAKDLLEQTDLSVRDVFFKVGYIDPTNASKKFRSHFGVTPSVYRQQHQK